MMGLAGAITPAVTGRVVVMISGDAFDGATGSGATLQIYFGTGSAPANGAGVTGSTAGSAVKFIAATTAARAPFALHAVITGLVVSTAYWLDVGMQATAANLATIENTSITAFEV